MSDSNPTLSVEERIAAVSQRLYGEPEGAPDADALDARDGGAVPEEPGEESDAGASESEPEIKSLNDLAEAIGVDPTTLYDLEFTLAGTGESLKLGEVKDRLQSIQQVQEKARAEREALQQERQQWQQQAQQWLATQQQQSAELDKARLEALQAEADMARVDWEAFEKADPGRAALEYAKMLRRQQAAQASFQTAQQTVQQQQWQAQQQWQQQQQQLRAEHDAKLLERIPDWRDPQKQQAELEAIWKWNVENYGFTPEELATAVDWRTRDMIRKAYLYDQLNAKKVTLEKTPKQILKAGLLKKPVADERIQALKSKAQKTRDRGDQVKAAQAILERAFSKR